MAQGIIKGPRMEYFILERIIHFLKNHYSLEKDEYKLNIKTEKNKEEVILKDPFTLNKTDDEFYTGSMFVTRDDDDPSRRGKTFTYLSVVELYEWTLYEYEFIEKNGKYIAYNPTPVT